MRLLEYLKTHRIGLEEFGQRIGRSASTVSRIARGETATRHDTMIAIVRATGGEVTYEDLIAAQHDTGPAIVEDASP